MIISFNKVKRENNDTPEPLALAPGEINDGKRNNHPLI